jgi:hypothetical protein
VAAAAVVAIPAAAAAVAVAAVVVINFLVDFKAGFGENLSSLFLFCGVTLPGLRGVGQPFSRLIEA